MDTAPHPELCTRIAAFLRRMQDMLAGSAPELFGQISRDVRARLAAARAMVRRFLHVVAAGIVLPPPRPALRPPGPHAAPRRGGCEPLFRLSELASRMSHGGRGGEGEDPPTLQWALMIEAVRQLSMVMTDPARHARRLARKISRQADEILKGNPLPAAVLRRLPPWVDALLCRLDEAARPEAWARLDSP